MRTHRQRTEHMQRSVAKAVQAGRDSFDYFDESDALDSLRKFLAAKGVQQQAIELQLSRLRYFGPFPPEEGHPFMYATVSVQPMVKHG